MKRMMKVWITEQYDTRPIDFATGKRIAGTPEMRETCACCGKKIFKVSKLSDGRKIGSECAGLVEFYRWGPEDGVKACKAMRISEKQAEFINTCY